MGESPRNRSNQADMLLITAFLKPRSRLLGNWPVAKCSASGILYIITHFRCHGAANPTFGRYDETKTRGENIDLQTTILSRFENMSIPEERARRR